MDTYPDTADRHPCGCPANVVTSALSNSGEQCSSCGSCWDGEDVVYKLREGPLNKAGYARLVLAHVTSNYDQARDRLEGLREYVRELAAQREAAADAVAKHAETDADLLSINGTRTGHDRIEEITRSLHPAFKALARWISDDDAHVGPHVPRESRLSPQLALPFEPADLYITELADALREFTARFVPTLPVSNGGRMWVGVLAHDCGELHDWAILFDPETQAAELVDTWGHEDPFTGTLSEVLAQAGKVAWFTGGPVDEVDD